MLPVAPGCPDRAKNVMASKWQVEVLFNQLRWRSETFQVGFKTTSEPGSVSGSEEVWNLSVYDVFSFVLRVLFVFPECLPEWFMST